MTLPQKVGNTLACLIDNLGQTGVGTTFDLTKGNCLHYAKPMSEQPVLCTITSVSSMVIQIGDYKQEFNTATPFQKFVDFANQIQWKSQ